MLGFLSAAPVLWAGIEPVPNIEKLVSSAPVIVVGYVADVSDAGTGKSWTEALTWTDGTNYPLSRKLATVRVAEVLKGDVASPSIRITFDENLNGDAGSSILNLSKGDRRIFFLRSGAGGFTFSNGNQSAMPVSGDPTALPRIAEFGIYAEVMRLMAASLFSVTDAPQDRAMALLRISTESSPVATELLRQALVGRAVSSDADLRFNLLAALVRRKDEVELQEFEAALFSTDDARFNSARANMVLALQEWKPAVAVPLLIRALRDQQPGVRMAAAEAMQQRYNDDAVEALLNAVDDPDPDVQWQVIAVLESVVDKKHCLPSSPDQREAFTACVATWHEIAAKSADLNAASSAVH